MATYNITDTFTPVAGDIINCAYSGAGKSIVLPKGIYKLEVWGAMGGYRSSTSYAGKGGYSVGTITLPKKTTVYAYAGGAGRTAGSASGGFNGGGTRTAYYGGGGGSDFRIGTDSLYARVIVAGGGGSDGSTSRTGMYGGGTTGGTSTQSCGTGGDGGTQTAGGTGSTSNTATAGSFGKGGNGIYYASGYGGAGGGGWYGGAGSYPDGSADDDRGGGGGSGYVYTSATAANYPSGCLLTSDYYLTGASTTAGNVSFTGTTGTAETGHASDGYCRITVIEVQSCPAIRVKVGGEYKEATKALVKVDGSWKEITALFSKVNGEWKSS